MTTTKKAAYTSEEYSAHRQSLIDAGYDSDEVYKRLVWWASNKINQYKNNTGEIKKIAIRLKGAEYQMIENRMKSDYSGENKIDYYRSCFLAEELLCTPEYEAVLNEILKQPIKDRARLLIGIIKSEEE